MKRKKEKTWQEKIKEYDKQQREKGNGKMIVGKHSIYILRKKKKHNKIK